MRRRSGIQEQMRSLLKVRETDISTLFGRGHPQHVTNRAENALWQMKELSPQLNDAIQTCVSSMALLRDLLMRVKVLANEVTAFTASVEIDGTQNPNDIDVAALKSAMDDLQDCLLTFSGKAERKGERLQKFRDDVARDLLRHTDQALAAVKRIQQKV